MEDLGGYAAREDGKIFDTSGQELKVYEDGTVLVRDDFGCKKRLQAHHLIAKAFVFNPDPLHYKFVMFKDGNKKNRRADNLWWSRSKRGTAELKPTDSKKELKKVRVFLMSKEGLAPRHIAEACGVSEQYVRKLLRE